MELLQKIIGKISKTMIQIRFLMLKRSKAPYLTKKLPLPSPVSLVFIKESDILKYMDCMPLIEADDETEMEERLTNLSQMFIDLKKRTGKPEDMPSPYN